LISQLLGIVFFFGALTAQFPCGSIVYGYATVIAVINPVIIDAIYVSPATPNSVYDITLVVSAFLPSLFLFSAAGILAFFPCVPHSTATPLGHHFGAFITNATLGPRLFNFRFPLAAAAQKTSVTGILCSNRT